MSESIPTIALRDRRAMQLGIQSEYGEWVPVSSFEWDNEEWTIDGMEPYEWAEDVFGEDD